MNYKRYKQYWMRGLSYYFLIVKKTNQNIYSRHFPIRPPTLFFMMAIPTFIMFFDSAHVIRLFINCSFYKIYGLDAAPLHCVNIKPRCFHLTHLVVLPWQLIGDCVVEFVIQYFNNSRVGFYYFYLVKNSGGLVVTVTKHGFIVSWKNWNVWSSLLL